MAEIMNIRVLGTFDGVGPQGALSFQGSVPRTLLARLALGQEESVSRDALIDVLWQEQPPRTALTTLRSHLTRLRQQLDRAGMAGLIVAHGAGYRLGVTASVDAQRFECATDRGRDLLTAGDASGAAVEVRAALGMWRGEPFADLRPSDWASAEAACLNEARLNAVENLYRARIMLAEHESLIGELERHVTEFPFRERLWETLMLALHGSGRRADALAAYQRAHEIFVADLGIEPGPELRRLHAAILDGQSIDASPSARADMRLSSGRGPTHLGNHIPLPPTSFVARQKERSEVKSLLCRARLVTLTGVGGVGKSRLAMQVASDLRTSTHGVWYIDLSALQGPDLILHLINETLDIQNRTSRDLMDQIVTRLGGDPVLIVFDNCEHALSTSARVIDQLLQRLPTMKILATSRQALTVQGEHIFMVPPLEVPEEPGPQAENPAVTLFMERAVAAVPGCTFAEERDSELTARICRRLEGIPLAIELAAVQLRVLSIPDLLQRLDDRFDILATSHRTLPKRHHTLRATIDWSFGLCTTDEQVLWSCLSVFRETFDLTAVERVVSDIDFRRDDLLLLMAGLVEKSVLMRENHRTGVRFRMLDSLREYGRSKLRDTGMEKRLLIRHRDYFLGLAEEGDQAWAGPDQLTWFDQMRLERSNLRAAFDFCLSTADETETGLRLAAALHMFWVGCDFLAEGKYWLDLALGAGASPTSARAHALWVAGRVDCLLGDMREATAKLDEASTLAVQVGDWAALACATHIRGTSTLIMDCPDAARDLLEEAVCRYRSLDDPPSMSIIASVHLAMAELLCGAPLRTVELCQESLRVCVAHDEQWIRSYGLYVLGCAEHQLGRPEQAIGHLREALLIKWRFHDVVGLAMTLDQYARTVADLGRAESAALLLGAAQQCWNTLGKAWFGSPTWRQIREQAECVVRQKLDAAEFEVLFRRGCDQPLERSVHAAVEDTDIDEVARS